MALEVPDALKDQAAALPRKGLRDARWSHRDDLHITLRFIGDVPEDNMDSLAAALESVRVASFTVVVKSLEAFEKRHQSILYAPVESHRAITHLSAEITDRLVACGLEFPMRDYTPHVTLARLERHGGLPDYIDHYKKQVNVSWTAREFSLFSSAHPDSDGKRYKKIRAYALKAR